MTSPDPDPRPVRQPGPQGLLAWLQLVRLPAVFTALGDVLLGILLVQAPLDGTVTPWLLAASAALYLSGMVFNDIFDRHVDRLNRPNRPLPSGRVSLRGAITLGVVLMAGGLAAAAVAGTTALLVAAALAGCVLAYDAWLKGTLLGPLVMGACRFFNVLLGAAAVGSLEGVFAAMPLHVAAGLGLYILGVTWFARDEAETGSRGRLVAALVIINAGLATLIDFVARRPETDTTSVLLLLVLIVVTINRRLGLAVSQPTPANVQAGVSTLLLSLVLLDAALALAVTGRIAPALLIALLLLPAILLKRWIPLT